MRVNEHPLWLFFVSERSIVGDLAEELTDALVTVGPRLVRVPSFATCCCTCVPLLVPQQVPSLLSSRALNNDSSLYKSIFSSLKLSP